jgi:ATPase subunit of ABC transporter with duplicated ATPase domains
MLAAMEDLLDTWPGTLLVVSHDRYLLERVTDQQYAVLDGRMRHLPGGVDEYLRLRAAADAGRGSATPAAVSAAPDTAASTATGLSGAERRAVEKELAATERKLERTQQAIDVARSALHDVDPSDYVRLGEKQAVVAALESEAAELEEAWLDLGARLEG